MRSAVLTSIPTRQGFSLIYIPDCIYINFGVSPFFNQLSGQSKVECLRVRLLFVLLFLTMTKFALTDKGVHSWGTGAHCFQSFRDKIHIYSYTIVNVPLSVVSLCWVDLTLKLIDNKQILWRRLWQVLALDFCVTK